jgi:hypothetical protein
VDEEWRLTTELEGAPEEVDGLVSRITERLPEGARLTRDGFTTRVYSDGEADAARVEAIALALLGRTGLGYELWHDRWDEDATEWEEIAPDLPPGEEPPDLSDLSSPAAAQAETAPLEGAAGEDEPEAIEVSEAGFAGAVTSLADAQTLVVLMFPDRDSGVELRARLVAEGIPLVSRRRGFGVPAADEAAAERLAASLRAQAPPGTTVETRAVPGRSRG